MPQTSNMKLAEKTPRIGTTPRRLELIGRFRDSALSAIATLDMRGLRSLSASRSWSKASYIQTNQEHPHGPTADYCQLLRRKRKKMSSHCRNFSYLIRHLHKIQWLRSRGCFGEFGSHRCCAIVCDQRWPPHDDARRHARPVRASGIRQCNPQLTFLLSWTCQFLV